MKVKVEDNIEFILKCFDVVASTPELADEFRKSYGTSDEMTRASIKAGMVKKKAVKLIVKLGSPRVEHTKIKETVNKKKSIVSYQIGVFVLMATSFGGLISFMVGGTKFLEHILPSLFMTNCIGIIWFAIGYAVECYRGENF